MAVDTLEDLIRTMARLPGLGPRSARRLVLHLLKNKEKTMLPLLQGLTSTAAQVMTCATCGNLDTQDPCGLCRNDLRDRSTLCVVEDVADLWAVERTRTFRGLYHVLGGTLSALDGVGPDQLNIAGLMRRMTLAGGDIREVILATNATVEGQTTAHYLTEKLRPFNVRTTRLAHGVPLGGELDYLDDGTLTAALSSRLPF